MPSAAAPVAPLSSHALLIFLLQVGILLGLAVLLGRLAVKLKMPALVGELAAGVLMGPSLLDQIAPAFADWLLPKDAVQFNLLDAFGQIGVLLLVGITGMQLDLGLVRRKGVSALKISACGLLIPLGLGIACGFLLPAALRAEGSEQGVFAFFLGVAMCVSAIPVIAKILIDMGMVHRNVGQMTLTAGMIDDAVGWLLLSVVSAMATVGVSTGKVAASVGYLALVVVLAVLARVPLKWLLRLTNKQTDPGVTLASIVVLMLLAAAGTHALGLEPIFGAFIGGIVIGSTGLIDAERLAPLRKVVLVFLAPVFFAIAGLRMDLTALRHLDVLVAGVVVLTIAIVGKFVGAFLGSLLSKFNRWEALALGAGMNARGVVEVVVAMVGLRLGVLTTASYTIIILVAVVTSLMAPPILRLAMSRVDKTAEEELREERLGGTESVSVESGSTRRAEGLSA